MNSYDESAIDRVVVTGGSGFIGTNLIEFLRNLEPQVEILNLDKCAPRNPKAAGEWVEVDLLDGNAVSEAIRGFAPRYVFHLGARTDLQGKSAAEYEANVQGLRAVIEAVRGTPSVERTIYASSRLVCKIGYLPQGEADYCPPNAYGESKVAGELIVRAEAPGDWVIVRPTSIWGPWFGVPYRDFFDSVLRGRYVHIGSAELPKSFGYVGNSAYQLWRIATSPTAVSGQTLYLGDYPPIEVGSFAEEIRVRVGLRSLPRVPIWVMKPVAIMGDLLAKGGWVDVPLTSFRLRNLLTPMVYDLDPLEAVVGPLPYTAEEGINATLTWMGESTSGLTRAASGPQSPAVA